MSVSVLWSLPRKEWRGGTLLDEGVWHGGERERERGDEGSVKVALAANRPLD